MEQHSFTFVFLIRKQEEKPAAGCGLVKEEKVTCFLTLPPPGNACSSGCARCLCVMLPDVLPDVQRSNFHESKQGVCAVLLEEKAARL